MKYIVALLLCVCFSQTHAQGLNLAGIATTTTTAAYSTRLVNSSYTGPCLRVRRALDNAEADVAFNTTYNMLLQSSTVTITAAGSSGLTIGTTMPFDSFYAATSCFVTNWYDQSGNGRHAIQATAASQPRIVNAGVLDRLNGYPALTFENFEQWMAYTSTNITVQTVTAVRAAPDVNWQYLVALPANSDFSIRSSNGQMYTTSPNGNDWWYNTGSPNQFWVNGVQNQSFTAATVHTITANTANPVTSTMSISSTFYNRGMYGGAALAELLLFPAPLTTTNRQALQTNQNAFFIAHALPLQLISFTGHRNNATTQLQWQTADETNTRQFVIERKMDDGIYNAISTVTARGQGNAHYAYSDNGVPADTAFYRLKMEDLDGRFTFSNTVMVTASSTLQTSKAYPNPAHDKVCLQVTDKKLLRTTGKILDANGKLLFTFTINDWKQFVNMRGLPAGTCLMQLKNGEVLFIKLQ